MKKICLISITAVSLLLSTAFNSARANQPTDEAKKAEAARLESGKAIIELLRATIEIEDARHSKKPIPKYKPSPAKLELFLYAMKKGANAVRIIAETVMLDPACGAKSEAEAKNMAENRLRLPGMLLLDACANALGKEFDEQFGDLELELVALQSNFMTAPKINPLQAYRMIFLAGFIEFAQERIGPLKKSQDVSSAYHTASKAMIDTLRRTEPFVPSEDEKGKKDVPPAAAPAPAAPKDEPKKKAGVP